MLMDFMTWFDSRSADHASVAVIAMRGAANLYSSTYQKVGSAKLNEHFEKCVHAGLNSLAGADVAEGGLLGPIFDHINDIIQYCDHERLVTPLLALAHSMLERANSEAEKLA